MKKNQILFLMLLIALSGLTTVSVKASNSNNDNKPATDNPCAGGNPENNDSNEGVRGEKCSGKDPETEDPKTKDPKTEDTKELCSDGQDNDKDGLIDLLDLSCLAFVTPVDSSGTSTNPNPSGTSTNPNPFATTTATSTDSTATTTATSTESHATTTPVVTVTPTPTSSGSSFGSGPSFSSSFNSPLTSGTPVSAIATSSEPNCPDMFKTYMRKGKVNNTNEVKKLQKFLNIKTTGFFGTLTENAVKTFQLKYTDSVLTPWGITAPTGYFFKTTQRQANILLCSAVEIPMPVLK